MAWLSDGPGWSSFKPRPDDPTPASHGSRLEANRSAEVSTSGVAPDGRRKFGTVRDAIVQVLAQADRELRVREIQKGVEDVLGGPVSHSSVKDYLRKGCRRRVPVFEYRGRRGYRLAE